MWTLLALASLAIARAKPAQDVSTLVERLGSDHIEEREEAECSLKRIGKTAVWALDHAAGDADSEVAGRARYLARFIRHRQLFTDQLRKAFPKIDDRLARGTDHDFTEVFLTLWGSRPLEETLSKKDLEPLSC